MSWRRLESLSARGAEGIVTKVEVQRSRARKVGPVDVVGAKLAVTIPVCRGDGLERTTDVYKL